MISMKICKLLRKYFTFEFIGIRIKIFIIRLFYDEKQYYDYSISSTFNEISCFTFSMLLILSQISQLCIEISELNKYKSYHLLLESFWINSIHWSCSISTDTTFLYTWFTSRKCLLIISLYQKTFNRIFV